MRTNVTHTAIQLAGDGARRIQAAFYDTMAKSKATKLLSISDSDKLWRWGSWWFSKKGPIFHDFEACILNVRFLKRQAHNHYRSFRQPNQ